VRQAIEYARGNWAALCRYTEDGRLDIDNGEAERTLRGIALGRRNWLFCGSDRGGRAAAVHFSLIASCHRHHVDPFAYLRDLFECARKSINRDEVASFVSAEPRELLEGEDWSELEAPEEALAS
jgi:hypothetical protein